jgi:hypothetical protein
MPFNNEISYRANGTIAPCRFVVIDTTADERVIQASAATTELVGISQEGQKRTPGLAGSDTTIAAEAGDSLRVHGLGNDCLLTLGGTVTRGDLLTSDANGQGITASAGNFVGAIALQSGTSGVKIRVQVVQMKA